MAYAQTSYKDKVGNSNLTIAEVGCFDTADCNLLLDAGINIDPASLNQFYKAHNLYTYDLTDRANDDITWTTVSQYCPAMTVTKVGGNDWPSTNLAIVKFVYKDHSGRTTTHFCKVADHNNHLILDSWDGKVKSPGNYYGEPVAYAEYMYDKPQSAPVAVEASYTPVPHHKVVVLPASIASWTVYKVGSGLRKGTDDQLGQLAPAKYGGLEYPIVQWVGDYAVIIDTQSFGRVTIWVKDTAAQFQDALTPVPAAPTPPANPSYIYERFKDEAGNPKPIEVQTKLDANVWDLNFTGGYGNAKSNGVAPKGTRFTAIGKATKQDMPEHPVYYMSNESFGNADTTGTPAFNQGVNTADLEPAPAAVPTETAPVTTDISHENIDDTSGKVAVTVMPASPDGWKKTFTEEGKGEYEAEANTTVHDLDGKIADIDLIKGMKLQIAGTFTGPDFIKYYRTVKSVERGDWRGIPTVALKDDDDLFTYIDSTIDDFKEGIGQISRRKKAIIAAAKVDMNAKWLRDRLKKKDKV